MELQVHEGKPEEQRLRSTLSGFKNQIEDFKKRFEKIKEEEERKILMTVEESDDEEEDVTKALIKNQKVLENSSQSIQRSVEVLNETEEIGIELMGNLSTQKEKMKGQKKKLERIEGTLSITNRILNNLAFHETKLKLIIITLIVLIMIMLGITGYFYVAKLFFNK